MSEINELMESLNIEPESLASFAAKVKTNPMAAVGAFSELGLSMEFFAKLFDIIRRDPEALGAYAASLGMDASAIGEAQKQAEQLLRP